MLMGYFVVTAEPAFVEEALISSFSVNFSTLTLSFKTNIDENVEEKLTEYFQKHGIIKEQTLFEMVS